MSTSLNYPDDCPIKTGKQEINHGIIKGSSGMGMSILANHVLSCYKCQNRNCNMIKRNPFMERK